MAFARILVLTCIAWCALAPGRAAADEPQVSLAQEGRGMLYGVSGAFALTLTPQTNIETFDQPSLQPGWASLGRFGFELPSGVAFAIRIGGGGFSASMGAPSLALRAFGEVRWTIDTPVVRPYIAVAGGYLLLRAGPNLRSTFTMMASLGVDIPLASWAFLDIGVAAEVVVPGDALRTALALLYLPEIGLNFRF